MQDFHAVLERFRGIHVLVVGDVILDQYTYGVVSRVAPEAPVPVLHQTRVTCNLGGAANLARNAATLGATVTIGGVIGHDAYSDLVIAQVHQYGMTSYLHVHDQKPTTVKHRMVTTDAKQLIRLDEEDREPIGEDIAQRLYEQIDSVLATQHILVLSDYGLGCLSPHLVTPLISRARELGIPTIADMKPQSKALFHGVSVVCVNRKEASDIVGAANTDDLGAVGRRLMEELEAAVFIKRGLDGVSVFEFDGTHTHIPGRKVEIFDATGVRDTFSAAAAIGIAAGLPLVDAARLANIAGSIVVRKPGVATVSFEELASAVSKIPDVADVAVVPKVWGYEKWLENNDKYCCKLLVLKKGFQCSLHYHENKDEMFLVTEGQVRMEIGGAVYHMMPGHYLRLKPGTQHRFTGVEDSVIVEVSTTHHEEDSHRLELSKQADQLPV